MPVRRTTDEELVVCGVNAVLGLLQSGHPTARVYVRSGERPEALSTALARSDAVVTEASPAELERLAAGARHQGLVALARPFRYGRLGDVVATPGRGAVALDGIVDPRNLGAIARSARAAGVRGLVVPRDRSAPVTSVVATASAGTIFGLAVARVANLVRAMEELKEAGMWTVGLDASAERVVARLPPLDEPVVVVGTEGKGLRRLVRERCDFLARVPMAGPVESLNASVATSVALYELVLRGRDGV
jgi:23S rRNA (guanosine2251-2'-O)-methyltransferase